MRGDEGTSRECPDGRAEGPQAVGVSTEGERCLGWLCYGDSSDKFYKYTLVEVEGENQYGLAAVFQIAAITLHLFVIKS